MSRLPGECGGQPARAPGERSAWCGYYGSGGTVDEDESAGGQRSFPLLTCSCEQEKHRDPESSRYCLPLAYDCCRDEACGWATLVEQRRNCESDEGLPAAHRIRQHGSARAATAAATCRKLRCCWGCSHAGAGEVSSSGARLSARDDATACPVAFAPGRSAVKSGSATARSSSAMIRGAYCRLH